ncbi:MAG: hypothetical protein IJ804_07300 [Prevotella sp.]|nr:hypothetical protein [Prevotella sp.]
MKKIFKFFSAALAVAALASCSSDDLDVSNSIKEIEYSPNKLLVQVEGSEDASTRSGFITLVDNYSLYSSFFFSQGDVMKLYHNATSWKPETWTASEFGQYKNSGGVAVFTADAGGTITTAEDAYGIFPSTIGQFGNENRTSLAYDLSSMRFIDYSAESKAFDSGSRTGTGTAYVAPFPLWGVKAAGETVMTVKHLAGILRVDLANIDNSTMAANQARFIVIQSANNLSGKLQTAADLLNPTAAEKLNVGVDNLMTAAPKLKTAVASGATPLNAVPITTAGLAAGQNDVIVVKLTKDDPNHVMLFVPITPDNTGGNINVYVSTPVVVTGGGAVNTIAVGAGQAQQAKMADGVNDAIYTLDATTIQAENEAQPNASGWASLAAADKVKVQPGVFYRINDDSSNRNTTATTPFELTKGIIEADQAAYRDFEITFTKDIEVKNTGASNPQNYYIDFTNTVSDYRMTDLTLDADGGWTLKHNVTVNLTLKESGDAGTTPSVLYVKTKGGKTLTLNITNGGTAVDSVVVNKGDLKSNLVLKEATGGAQLPNIHINSGNDDKVTLKAGATKLIANSNVTVDNASGQLVADIVLAEGISKLSMLDGTVTKIELATTGGTNPRSIANNVTIYTEGNASIAQVDYANMPKTTTAGGLSTDTYNLIYSSKWIAGSAAGAATTTITGNAATFITSAAQLAGVAAATGDVTVLGSYDLDGTNSAWTPLAGLTQNITGAQYYRFSNAAARAITGNTTIANLAGVNGLIADWTPAAAANTISNITFNGGNAVTGAANAGALGLLVGTVDTQNAAGTIKNISVTGTNSVTGSGTTPATMQGYGAVIGKTQDATNALNIVNVQVAEGTTVHGYQYVGGIVGEVAGKVVFGLQNGATDKIVAGAAVAAGDVANSSAATLETFKVGSAPYSSALPSKGSFFGGASASATAGDVTIIGGLTLLGTARTGTEWGYYVPNAAGTEYDPWTINLYYNEIGHCGTTMAGSAVTVTAGFNAFYMYTSNGAAVNPTYSVKTNLEPTVGVAYPTGAGVGIGNTLYFDWVKQP